MGIIGKLQKIYFYFNYLRAIPVYIAYKSSLQRDKIKMDLDRWKAVVPDNDVQFESDLHLLNRLLINQMPFRNLIQKRFRTPPYTFKNVASYYLTLVLWRKDA